MRPKKKAKSWRKGREWFAVPVDRASGVQSTLRFRKGDKEVMLHTSNRFALAGIVGLSVSIVAVVWLVSDLVISRTAANVIESGQPTPASA